MSEHKIKIEQFEGPLSLLLKMIEKEEMDIAEISLAKIADQYVDYIRTSAEIKPEETADFLVVASRLLLIKSRALLPFLLKPEEEEEIEDLERQLRMYKEFVEAAKKIEKILDKKKFMFAREFNRKIILDGANIFSPPKNIDKDELETVFRDVLSRLRPPEKIEEKRLASRVTIDEKINHILQSLLDRIKINFSKIIERAEDKTEVIVSFLAMLELMRQRRINLTQEEMFGEIIIEREKK